MASKEYRDVEIGEEFTYGGKRWRRFRGPLAEPVDGGLRQHPRDRNGQPIRPETVVEVA